MIPASPNTTWIIRIGILAAVCFAASSVLRQRDRVANYEARSEREHARLKIIDPLIDPAKLDPLLMLAHPKNGVRERIQREALLRNLVILEHMGCLAASGMEKLRRGKAPAIRRPEEDNIELQPCGCGLFEVLQ